MKIIIIIDGVKIKYLYEEDRGKIHIDVDGDEQQTLDIEDGMLEAMNTISYLHGVDFGYAVLKELEHVFTK